MTRAMIITTIITLGVILTAPPPADAKCPPPGPPRPSTSGSWYHVRATGLPGVDVGGIYANLDNRTAWVEANYSDNFSAAWVQVGRWPSTWLWAQVGWIEHRYGARADYYEYWPTDAYVYRRHRDMPFSQPVGDRSEYKVLFNNAGPFRMSFFVDGQEIHTGTVGWVPNRWDVSGEVNNLANQMPGGYADGMYFTGTRVWYNNAWRTPTSLTWDNVWPQYFAQWGSPQSGIGIWDRSCYD